jgi:hypothetical protein
MGSYEGMTGTAPSDDSREYRSALLCQNAMKDRLLPAPFRQIKERIMRQKTLTALILLLASTASQAAVATEHHHARTRERPVILEQWRNSNAYAAPGDSSALTEGAMASGIAGR